MKLFLNPVIEHAKRVEQLLNNRFAATAQDIAHHRKRQMALDYQRGGEALPELIEAAEIEGMPFDQFVVLIASKPDAMMQAENKRRSLVVAVRAAKTIEEINTILDRVGVLGLFNSDLKPIA